jgi:large subunit ribosomal protein L24
VKKGDNVIVLLGRDKGKKGKILEVFPKEGKAIVERVNVSKRHQKPMRNFPGGIIDKALPVFLSKLMLVCPRCGVPTRIAHKKEGRTCKKCGEVVDKI